jgi:hypothetical protein
MKYILRKDYHAGGIAYVVVDPTRPKDRAMSFDSERSRATRFNTREEAVDWLESATGRGGGIVTILAVQDSKPRHPPHPP